MGRVCQRCENNNKYLDMMIGGGKKGGEGNGEGEGKSCAVM